MTALDKPGALSVTLGAAIWGLFWIPLHTLDRNGVTGLWAVALVLSAATAVAVSVMFWRGQHRDLFSGKAWLVGLSLGLSTVLYFAGVLLSDVIRVIFLFYLLPIWTLLAAWLIYGEPIRRERFPVIAAALFGVWLLLGGGTGLPLPQNIGDLCGIGAGLCWGISLALLRGRDFARPLASTTGALAAGAVLALSLACVLAVTTDSQRAALPSVDAWLHALPMAVLFGALLLYPSMFSQIWGARRIPAPTAALLTMVEILVATLTAWWLIGTELTPVSLLGGLIIVTAVALDLWRQQQLSSRLPNAE